MTKIKALQNDEIVHTLGNRFEVLKIDPYLFHFKLPKVINNPRDIQADQINNTSSQKAFHGHSGWFIPPKKYDVINEDNTSVNRLTNKSYLCGWAGNLKSINMEENIYMPSCPSDKPYYNPEANRCCIEPWSSDKKCKGTNQTDNLNDVLEVQCLGIKDNEGLDDFSGDPSKEYSSSTRLSQPNPKVVTTLYPSNYGKDGSKQPMVWECKYLDENNDLKVDTYHNDVFSKEYKYFKLNPILDLDSFFSDDPNVFEPKTIDHEIIQSIIHDIVMNNKNDQIKYKKIAEILDGSNVQIYAVTNTKQVMIMGGSCNGPGCGGDRHGGAANNWPQRIKDVRTNSEFIPENMSKYRQYRNQYTALKGMPNVDPGYRDTWATWSFKNNRNLFSIYNTNLPDLRGYGDHLLSACAWSKVYNSEPKNVGLGFSLNAVSYFDNIDYSKPGNNIGIFPIGKGDTKYELRDDYWGHNFGVDLYNANQFVDITDPHINPTTIFRIHNNSGENSKDNRNYGTIKLEYLGKYPFADSVSVDQSKLWLSKVGYIPDVEKSAKFMYHTLKANILPAGYANNIVQLIPEAMNFYISGETFDYSLPGNDVSQAKYNLYNFHPYRQSPIKLKLPFVNPTENDPATLVERTVKGCAYGSLKTNCNANYELSTKLSKKDCNYYDYYLVFGSLGKKLKEEYLKKLFKKEGNEGLLMDCCMGKNIFDERGEDGNYPIRSKFCGEYDIYKSSNQCLATIKNTICSKPEFKDIQECKCVNWKDSEWYKDGEALVAKYKLTYHPQQECYEYCAPGLKNEIFVPKEVSDKECNVDVQICEQIINVSDSTLKNNSFYNQCLKNTNGNNTNGNNTNGSKSDDSKNDSNNKNIIIIIVLIALVCIVAIILYPSNTAPAQVPFNNQI